MTTSTLEREKNREKQRLWRQNNLEKSREMKKVSNWKKKGMNTEQIQERLKQPKKERYMSNTSIASFGVQKVQPEIEVALCLTCYRKYLPKLHCLFCNKYNK